MCIGNDDPRKERGCKGEILMQKEEKGIFRRSEHLRKAEGKKIRNNNFLAGRGELGFLIEI
jgi:hypothetical protein